MDQSIKHELEPGEHLSTQEFWFPTSAARDIRRIALPKVELTPVEEIPLFSWPDRRRVRFWCRLENAFATQTTNEIPVPPTPAENNWAPSGMEQLGDALAWAIDNAADDDEDSWRFQLGAWHAGRDEIAEALHHLTNARDDRARALAGRIYRRCKQDAATAVEWFGRIQSDTFALHPQVVVERDLALAALGSETLAERGEWLDRTAALDDEWLIERRAALACDEDRYEDARRILIDARFQFIHQRYVRADLWKKIAAALEEPAVEIPDSLGEDDLAQWGVYREYEEE